MMNQEFKARGRKYYVLPNFGLCCRELEGLKATSFHTCVRSVCYVYEWVRESSVVLQAYPIMVVDFLISTLLIELDISVLYQNSLRGQYTGRMSQKKFFYQNFFFVKNVSFIFVAAASMPFSVLS